MHYYSTKIADQLNMYSLFVMILFHIVYKIYTNSGTYYYIPVHNTCKACVENLRSRVVFIKTLLYLSRTVKGGQVIFGRYKNF